ncbi:MAG: hypothetical protein FWC19_06910, partial [Treponema sp.]|nr:hypothetical protein [Treponema sp.]
EHIGMSGIPLDPYPYYPENAKTLFLTADAAWDKDITGKIKQSLLNGSKVFITANLYKNLADRGIKDILPMEITDRKVITDKFTNSAFGRNNCGYLRSETPVTIPHIAYNENDIWVLSSALTPYSSHPLLLCGSYGKGTLYVLAVPDVPADLYKLPAETLTMLRREMNLRVTLECCGRVALFLYDNDTFIIQSFLDRVELVRLCINKPDVRLTPVSSPQWMRQMKKVRISDSESVFETHLMPGRYSAFRIEE